MGNKQTDIPVVVRVMHAVKRIKDAVRRPVNIHYRVVNRPECAFVEEGTRAYKNYDDTEDMVGAIESRYSDEFFCVEWNVF